MDKKFIKLWNENKGKLKEKISKTPQSEYEDYLSLVRLLIDNVINVSDYDIGNYDLENISVIDDGDYGGTKIFLIPSNSYEPQIDEYLLTYFEYGTCPTCDVLRRIKQHKDGLPNENQVKDYMTLCLHLIQRMKKLKDDDIDCEFNTDKIINLIGPSGSGKTTIAKKLEEKGYNIIHSYTTRSPRKENEWGHTFVDEGDMAKDFTLEIDLMSPNSKNIPKENVIAYEELYEGIHYWATKAQYKGRGISIYVVTPDGAEQVRKNVKDAEIINIYLNADEITRDFRMKLREGLNPLNLDLKRHAEITEIKKRIIKDRDIFKTVKCDYIVDANRDIDEVMESILSILEGLK